MDLPSYLQRCGKDIIFSSIKTVFATVRVCHHQTGCFSCYICATGRLTVVNAKIYSKCCTWGRMMCWMSLDNPPHSAESVWESTASSHSVLDPWGVWPSAALFLVKQNQTCYYPSLISCFVKVRGKCKCQQLPDENYLDFRRSVIDDGGGIMVTPAIQDLTIDLEEKSSPQWHFCFIPSISTLIYLSTIFLWLSSSQPSEAPLPQFPIPSVLHGCSLQESSPAPTILQMVICLINQLCRYLTLCTHPCLTQPTTLFMLLSILTPISP